eukprot:1175656-Prorocentrum_minimum.AAC.1
MGPPVPITARVTVNTACIVIRAKCGVGCYVGWLQVGLKVQYLEARLGQGKAATTEEHRQAERVARKFMSALMLLDLVEERPVSEVVRKFGVKEFGGVSAVQALQEHAARFAGQVRRYND